MHPVVAELIGTMLLVLFGNGVVANVLLTRTKGHDGGWIVITAGWGLAVFVGAFCAHEYSGAHLNPAVTVAMILAKEISIGSAIGYIVGQFFGAVVCAVLVFLFYREHFKVTEDADAKLACFCTAPNIRNTKQAFFCETLGTFTLILPIFLIASPRLIEGANPADTDPVLGLGALGLLPVGLLVFAIGSSLGGTTGYAINPFRDFAPRLVHALAPIPGKRDSDWGYAWVPVVGPIFGAILAAIIHQLLT